MYFDSHAHITTQHDTPIEDYITTARAANVSHIVSVGCSPDHLEHNIRLCIQHTSQSLQLYPSIGVHPDYFQDPLLPLLRVDEELQNIETLLTSLHTGFSDTIVALGECGLDYYWPHHKEAQKKLLTLHIQKSFEWDLPLIIHIRDAWEDFFPFLEQFPTMRAVIHCFSGTKEIAEQLLTYPNIILSFSGVVTFPKAQEQYQETIASVPPDRFLIETDTPYLTPVPYRGKPNMPAYVVHTAEHIAGIRKVSSASIGELTLENAKTFFRIY